MLNKEELERSPLFEGITYDEYLRMLSCFQATQKTFQADEVIYDLTGPGSDALGILERGTASVIRIDEEGISTVLEELGPEDAEAYIRIQKKIWNHYQKSHSKS